MIKAVFFDLDGTLLPIDQDLFVQYYFDMLAKKFAAFGYEPNKLINAIIHASKAMIKNNGSRTNEAVFWEDYVNSFGEQARSHAPLFIDFYSKEYQKIKDICGFHYLAAKIVRAQKEKGRRVILATNPVFPTIATESRIRWAGLEPEDFELITSYENFNYCKPNLNYYRELLRRMNLTAKDSVMVGNDVEEDMIADQLGMKVFLMTECLINQNDADISEFPQGDFKELQEYLN